MILRTRDSQSSTEFNSVQQVRAICLKQKLLKIGGLRDARKPPWAQGVGRSNRPAPTKSLTSFELAWPLVRKQPLLCMNTSSLRVVASYRMTT